jgi:anti-sigma factor RsiW
MSCQEIESLILDYQENQLTPARWQAVETHLAGCAGCQAFARHLQQLDAALSRGVKVPALSADFDRRLWERIQSAPAALSEAQRAERKRQLQAEFDAGMAQLVRGSFAWHSFLRHLTLPLLAAVAGCLAWWLTPQLAALLKGSGPGGLGQNLLAWLVASAVFLAIGLAGAFPRPWKTLGLG